MATQAKNFRGSWRIVHMDTWDDEYLDLIEPASIAFDKGSQGEFVFGAVKAGSTAATANAMAGRSSSSLGKASARATKSADVVGPPKPQTASSKATSTSTAATTRPSRPRNGRVLQQPASVRRWRYGRYRRCPARCG